MRAGKLDRTVSIERVTESVTATGGVIKSGLVVATARAEIVRAKADEFLTGYGEVETASIVFRIRYRPDVTTADRVVFDGKAHDIKEVVEIGRRRVLELRCELVR